jgi:hypothetical protein
MSRMKVFTLALLGLTAALALPVTAAAQRATTDAARVLEVARRGNAQETWAAWSALPAGAAKLRTGVSAAIALKDLKRGVEFYGQLATSTKAPDQPLLKDLALATASELAAGTDRDAAVTACSAALRLSPTQQPCRELLERMASRGATAGEQALGAYALADVGLRPFPTLFTGLELNLSPGARLSFARRFPHLPAAERVGFIRPLLGEGDAMNRYEAVGLLGEIPGAAAENALRTMSTDDTRVRYARTVALALHGDTASVQALGTMFDAQGADLGIPAALALARSGDARGSAALDVQMRGPVDLQRLYAADAATKLNPTAGQSTILQTLQTGSPAIRVLAVGAAGRARLGMHDAVYSHLVGSEPELRAQTVSAIAETLLAPKLATPVQPIAPPPLPQ